MEGREAASHSSYTHERCGIFRVDPHADAALGASACAGVANPIDSAPARADGGQDGQPENEEAAMPLAAAQMASPAASSTDSVVQSQPVAVAETDGGHWGERFDRWFLGDLATLWR